MRNAILLIIALVASCLAPTLARGQDSIVVYSGRSESLMQPVFDRFEHETGVRVRVKYGSTSELAALLLEEGARTPAALYIAQDAGALGALAKESRFETLPEDVTDLVDARFRSPDNVWTGITGRARTVVYNTNVVSPDDLPDSILGFVDEQWRNRVAWAPANGSFQAFVTALRKTHGQDTASQWLRAIRDNGAMEYPKNSAIVQAVGSGEADVGFVNHYYLYRFLSQDPSFPAANHFLVGGDVGALVNVAGAGLLRSNAIDDDARGHALALIRFMLSESIQADFATRTYEYPLRHGVEPFEGLPPLTSIESPNIDLSDLDDLAGTLDLLRGVGVLP
ncbi:MAG: iron ABC transporter substrate-binding protein [Phycisphaerales bacterium JB043]